MRHHLELEKISYFLKNKLLKQTTTSIQKKLQLSLIKELNNFKFN